MTMTESRPAATAPAGATTTGAAIAESILATGDHKRLGRVQLAAGLVAILAGLVLQAFARAGAADASVLTAARLARAASAEATFLYVVGLPLAWFGLATIVVPLQIGATRLALPRLHAGALWSAIAGAVVLAAAYLAGPSVRASVLSPVPVAVARRSIPTELWATGLLVFTIALVLQAISFLTTILTERTEGMTLARVPGFTAGTLATSATLVLTAPVFIAGLALLEIDLHFRGPLFGDSLAALKVWQHTVFLPGRPEAFLLALPALGALVDVVSTHARRRILVPVAATGALAAYAALSLLAWPQGADRLRSVIQPGATVPAVLLLGPVGVLVLLLLGTLREGRPRLHTSVAAFAGSLLLLGLGLVLVVVAALATVDGAARSDAFRQAQVTVWMLGVPVVALVGGLIHWAPKISGRLPPASIGGLATLATLGGVAVTAGGGWAFGLGGARGLLWVAAAGAALSALGVLLALGLLGTGRPAPDDPYDGLTLEWATTSPPPPHNFDAIPEVRSASPLEDLRSGSLAAADTGVATTGGDRA